MKGAVSQPLAGKLQSRSRQLSRDNCPDRQPESER